MMGFRWKKLFRVAVVIAVAVVAPEFAGTVGSSITGAAATSTTAIAAGTAAITTGAAIATGSSPEEAIKAGATAGTAVAVGGTVAGATGSQIAGGSAGSAAGTVVAGGSEQDILRNAIAGGVGAGVTDATGSQAFGKAAQTYVSTGDPTAAVQSGLISQAGSEIRSEIFSEPSPPPPTPQQSAKSNLDDAISSANLTEDERTAVQQAIQDVYLSATEAQALPATQTDVGPVGTGRLGSPFAANDPRFVSAVAKNPNLLKSFSEYANTYGFGGSDAQYVDLLVKVYKEQSEYGSRQYKEILRNEIQKIIDKSPNVVTQEAYQIVNPALSPVISQEIYSDPVTSVDVRNIPGETPTLSPSAARLLNIYPSVLSAGQPVSEFSPAPQPSARTATQPDFAVRPSGGTRRPPSYVVAPPGREQYATVSGAPTPPTFPVSRGELDTTTLASLDTEPTDLPKDLSGTIPSTPDQPKPTRIPSTTTATTVKRTPSKLLQTIGADMAPISTTGLTAYRPAGEIESEETGKRREDVWNEASLRLKDALGL